MADELTPQERNQNPMPCADENALKSDISPVNLKEGFNQNTYSLNTSDKSQNNDFETLNALLPPAPQITAENNSEQNIPFDINNFINTLSGGFSNNNASPGTDNNSSNQQQNEEIHPDQNQQNSNFLGGIFKNLLGGGTVNLSAKMSNLKTEDLILIGLFFFLMQEKEKNSELLIALAILFFTGLE